MSRTIQTWLDKGYRHCRDCNTVSKAQKCPTCRKPFPGAQPEQKESTSGPNKTEQRFFDDCLKQHADAGAVVLFEGLTMKLRGGNKYTPDWVAIVDGAVTCYEVKARAKNGYRHPSYNRSRLAFNEAKELFPFGFHWAEWREGKWVVE